ncbi:MAG: TonB-dependent receptor [Myxococcales bacterium]|nr:TonB-dependent receptor [Myxococcales bacterium]
MTSNYASERVAAEASVYANHIADYIYLAPAIDDAGEPVFDVLVRGTFPRFVTRPVDALFYGADAGATVRVAAGFDIGSQLSMVRARNQTDSSFLVLIPADRLRADATYTHESTPLADRLIASVSATFVAKQHRFDPAADLAEPPDGYMLLDAEVGMETQVGTQDVKLSFHGANLLNAKYRDYTSLLRYFADQTGTQFMVRLRFSSTTSN